MGKVIGRPSKTRAVRAKQRESMLPSDLPEGMVDLRLFAPMLRKLGKHLLKNGLNGTLRNTCEELELNYGSVCSQIYLEKKKGNDFYRFLEEVSNDILDKGLIDVDTALVRGAVEGSHNHQKLYYLRTNRINTDTNINVNILTVGVNVGSGTPSDLDRKKGIIDVNPVIPLDDQDVFE